MDKAADHLQSQHQESRTGGERGGQETRGNNRRVPKGSGAQSHIQKGGDRMNTDGPHNGEKNGCSLTIVLISRFSRHVSDNSGMVKKMYSRSISHAGKVD